MVAGYYCRPRLVNIFLKRTEFKFEFIAVLQQEGLLRNTLVSYGNELQRSDPRTSEFINTNNFKTQIGQTSSKLYWSLAVLIIGGAGILFLDLRKYKIELIFAAIALLGMILLKIIYPAKAKNDSNPFLGFDETGLEVNGIKYPWPAVISWAYEPDDDRDGTLCVLYKKADDINAQIRIDLASTNTSVTALTLLLIHFKKYYG